MDSGLNELRHRAGSSRRRIEGKISPDCTLWPLSLNSEWKEVNIQ